MTFKACFKPFMFLGMAEGAILLGVFAGIFFEFFSFFRMTCLTSFAGGRGIGDANVEGGMWVAVAAKAYFPFPKSKMGLLRWVMTSGAFGNSFYSIGQMFNMAI